MTRVTQRTVYRINLPNVADQQTWDRFLARAKADGVSLGDLFRSLIFGYAAGATSIALPPEKRSKAGSPE